MLINDFKEAGSWLKHADAVLITASNGLSIAEGYNIFADNDDFKRYFGKFREKYGIPSLIHGAFTPMAESDHEEYMHAVHQYLIDDYNGSSVMRNLLDNVKGRPYFILTSNGDTHFQKNGFDENRIFEVEGNFDGLAEQSEEWNQQRERFTSFLQAYAAKNTVLFELGIGSRNQLIKAPTMQMVKEYSCWKYITMNMPDEINAPSSLEGRTIALEGDIARNLERIEK